MNTALILVHKLRTGIADYKDEKIDENINESVQETSAFNILKW